MSWVEAAKIGLSVVGSFAAVVIVVVFFWYAIWTLFLSKFDFIREIVTGGNNQQKKRKVRRE